MRTFSPRPFGRTCCAAAAILVLGSGPSSAADAPKASPAKTEKPADAKAATSPRAPDETERAAMLEILKADTTPERAAWISYGAGNAESQALADALAKVFRDAGWKVQSKSLGGMVLKPGVSILLAEEMPPPFAESAQKAMEASGLEVKSASGYRPYYEEKKAENPAWPGVPLEKDAAFVIVVGPEPKS